MKRCTSCGEEKNLTDFPKDRRRRDGHFPYCKKCHAEYQAAIRAGWSSTEWEANRAHHRDRYWKWRASDPEGTAAAIRAAAQLRRYGLTPEDYQRLLDAQGGTCAFEHCDRGPGDEKTGRLHVDHCHETGKVRGLLCWPHNLMLGLANDRRASLLDAIVYLERHPGPQVLKNLKVPSAR
ncbi:MAG: endonuclease VII domain-containing protein [Actinobacteria bacterium]|nr:endonuclease VII domain-containing protein [Actinomycetota bacterium]MBV9254894.1 endonuclease VII domain-containing protein [Actinomycetota bacterium]MBV9936199.1 endonuclease VII domain-containing protein [Actinomycetota bacterium]